MVSPASAPPEDLAIFLDADETFETALLSLSAAESLTDDLAEYLLEGADMPRPPALVAALHFCDFVLERNSEWQLAPRARNYLVERLWEHRELFRFTHQRLLEVARSSRLQEELARSLATWSRASGSPTTPAR